SHPTKPSTAPWLWSIRDHDLDLRVRPVGPAEVAAFQVCVDRAHEVQVLRHRLLLEPHGFEGFASVEVKGDPCDASVANGPHGATHDADLDSHPSPPSEVADQNHRIITCVDHVFDLDPIALPRLQPVKPQGPQTLKADESRALSGYERRRNYLDVLVEERRESLHHRSSGRVVTKRCHQVGIPARLKTPDKLHVL